MNRRSFIKNAGLLSTALVVSLDSYSSLIFGAGIKVAGRVTYKRKGIKGVVVSDGFSVVQTNSKGRYELPYNGAARFVFLSVSAGYAFPEQSGIAKHYQPLGKPGSLDFELVKLSRDDSKHSFIIWADPQVRDQADVELMLSQSVPDVQQLVKSMGAGALVHGIGVGDLVWDNHALFKSYNKAVAEMGIPFFQALGNHDMDYNKGGDEVSDNTFESIYGPTYYSFNRGKAHYVVLDDVRYLGKDRTYDGYISQQQLDWLKKDLDFVPENNLIVVSLHIPVHNHVKNNDALYSILKPFKNVHIMSGHTHYNTNEIKEGIYEHNHGTVCGAWWTGPICSDGAPNGYGVYEVDGTELKWYYKSTGLEKDHQLSIDIQELTNQKRMIVNVWNWDPEWKVEWWADEKFMGELEQQMGYDPLAVKLYKGENMPKRRSFAEPTRTDHLFVSHFGVAVRSVKIKVTDRFGNKFEKAASV